MALHTNNLEIDRELYVENLPITYMLQDLVV